MAGNQSKRRRVAKNSSRDTARTGAKRTPGRAGTKPVLQQKLVEHRLAEEKVRASERLLCAINRIQSLFIDEAKSDALCDVLLQEVLSLTDSGYGFIGGIQGTDEQGPHVTIHAITNLVSNEERKTLIAQRTPTVELKDVKTRFSEVMGTGRPVIVNEPANDPYAAGLPPGHPPIHAFLGLPIHRGELLIGMLGVANRPGGYDEAVIAYLAPFLSTCGQILEGYQKRGLRAEAEAALREANTAVELAMEGISRLDDSGRYIFVNQQYAALLGYRPDELVGQSWDITVHPDDRASVLTGFAEMLAMGKAEADLRGVKKDGSLIWKHAVIVKPDRSEGKASGHYCFVRDITERKREEALQAAEKQALELVAKGIPLNDVLAFICRSIETQTVPMLCAVMRVTDDGAHLSSAAGPSLPEEYNRLVHSIPIGPNVGSCGTAAFVRKTSIVSDIATDPLWKGYASVPLSYGLKACWSQPILSSTGTLLGTFAAYYRETREPELSDLKMVERASYIAAVAIEHANVTEALRESEGRFRTIADTTSALIWIAGLDKRCTYFNRRWLEYTGRSLEQELGDGWADGVHPDDAARCVQLYSDAFDRREAFEIEYRLRRADGQYGWLHDSGVPRFLSDRSFVGYLGACIDITARKLAEEARETLQYAVDRGMEGMALLDAEGRYIYLNEAHAKIYGYSAAELIGRSWKMLYAQDEAVGIEVRAVATMQAEQRWAGELVGRTKAGTVVNVEVGLQLLPRQGAIAEGFLCTCRDITTRKKAEESLQRTQFAMDHAVDAVYWIDPRARILYTNEAASVMLGYTADEFLRMTVHDLNPDFPPEVWPGWWSEMREKKVLSLETVHLRKDGRRIPIDIRVTFLAYGGQEFHCAYVRDISDRKQRDHALRESQERFELAARATNDGIWDWNILTGAQYWSDRHYKLFGLEPSVFTPTYDTWIALVHPDDVDRVDHATRYHLDTHEPYDVEMRVRMKDGTYRWFHDRGQAVWDAAGRPVRMVGSISDVTARRLADEELRAAHAELERRVAQRTVQLALANESLQRDIAERTRTEEALRESELRYKLLTEATFDGIAIHDQGVVLEVNPGLERMFGYESGELIGRSILDLVADESRDRVVANMEGGVTGPYEAIGYRKDGTTFPGEVVVRPYHFRGKEVRLVAGRDITERKHLEAERLRYTAELGYQVAQRTAEIARLEAQRVQTEKLAAMGRLAAGVAHEINNPIAGIKNAFALVRQAVDPAHPHYEFVGMINREIARVSSIVQNMYQLYRPESAKVEPVELRTMTNDIQALFAKRLQQRRLKLVIQEDPCFERLSVPRGDLLQVLLNLLNNAIDSSSEGGTVTVTFSAELERVRIAVADQGAGIPPDVRPYIFDPFYTTKVGSDQKGMGLGLSVSRSLVMAMGGTIEVETQSNRGSTFSIVLPRNGAVLRMREAGEIQQEVVINED